MAKTTTSSRHYENILMSIATVAISQVPGVVPLSAKRKKLFGRFGNRNCGVEVFTDGGRVTYDVSVCVRSEYRVPDVVYAIQEGIKKEVENATIFKIRAINVKVVDVIFIS